jgi:hypothetical protein
MNEEGEEEHPEWNAALELVVRKEGEQAAALFWLHNKASLWASKRADWIQIPSICLATITGFFSATSDLVPPVAIGAASVLVGILGTVNSYFKYSQKAEGHRITSLFYHKLYKTIETQLALPVRQRRPADEFLRELRDEMARVSEAAPVIPEHIIAAFKVEFHDGATSKPIIANGIDPIKIWREEIRIRTPEQAIPSTPKPKINITLV